MLSLNPSSFADTCRAGGILLPETPNSLIERGHLEEGREVLKRIRGTQHIDIEYEVTKPPEIDVLSTNPANEH